MPNQVIRERVDRRLVELYLRHLSLHDDEITGYYGSGFGYYKPDLVAQKPFSICLATTDGEVFRAGDHARPFPLQSISKMFVYGLALEAHGREHVMRRVGAEPSADAGEDALLGPDPIR